uniref:Glycosyltransferase n=1 Tax=Anthurium amnicola TaxID=1678845 RepID=A0A1D1ZI38_9ARAE
MAGEAPINLDIFFFPIMLPGHRIPMVDTARMLATRAGVRATIVATPASAATFQPAVDRATQRRQLLRVLLLPFPATSEAALPDLNSVPMEDRPKVHTAALGALREPFRVLLREQTPACVVFDSIYCWAVDVAREAGVPALAFNVTGFFAMCAYGAIRRQVPPRESLPAGTESSVVVAGLPHRLELLRTQLPDTSTTDLVISSIIQSEASSDGVVINSFYELEPDYVAYHRDVLGRRAWHLGPVSLYGDDDDNTCRGGTAGAVDSAGSLSWLDGKNPRSVVYVCFGTITQLADAQLREIAVALEGCGRPFVWVCHGGALDWLPEGFAERTAGWGLLITGWAPQVAILGHGAVGGFVTHCGWNSCLEAIAAGVPMVTWPLAAEQFYNEKLVTELLKVGAAVGSKTWTMKEEERELIPGEEIRKAVARVMGDGEEAAGMRRRVGELAAMARKATQEGGRPTPTRAV